MGYTIWYGAKDLTLEEIRRGIEYVRDNVDSSLFEITFINENRIVLHPKLKGTIEGFGFPPKPILQSNDYIQTGEVQPYDGNIKSLLGGLENLLSGKFAARSDGG